MGHRRARLSQFLDTLECPVFLAHFVPGGGGLMAISRPARRTTAPRCENEITNDVLGSDEVPY
jgi:hypothetical protein